VSDWIWIALTAAGCYLLKVAGLSVPPERLASDRVRRVALVVPPAFFGALVTAQTVAGGSELVVDPRLAGLAGAAVALLLRAPFLVVLAVAAIVTGVVRSVA
jgi:uncharacterized membrane protein